MHNLNACSCCASLTYGVRDSRLSLLFARFRGVELVVGVLWEIRGAECVSRTRTPHVLQELCTSRRVFGFRGSSDVNLDDQQNSKGKRALREAYVRPFSSLPRFFRFFRFTVSSGPASRSEINNNTAVTNPLFSTTHSKSYSENSVPRFGRGFNEKERRTISRNRLSLINETRHSFLAAAGRTDDEKSNRISSSESVECPRTTFEWMKNLKYHRRTIISSPELASRDEEGR